MKREIERAFDENERGGVEIGPHMSRTEIGEAFRSKAADQADANPTVFVEPQKTRSDCVHMNPRRSESHADHADQSGLIYVLRRPDYGVVGHPSGYNDATIHTTENISGDGGVQAGMGDLEERHSAAHPSPWLFNQCLSTRVAVIQLSRMC
jgi:hypothetical protein